MAWKPIINTPAAFRVPPKLRNYAAARQKSSRQTARAELDGFRRHQPNEHD
jgi:hypothetical protein